MSTATEIVAHTAGQVAVQQPTPAELQEWFRYDADSGIVTWKRKPSRNIRVGQQAGYLWSEKKSQTSYIRVGFRGRAIFAHHIAFALMTGAYPRGMVDHQDGCGTNNQWANLRDVSHAENMRNQRRNSANSSGVVGVDYHGAAQGWRARIIVAKREHHLGIFPTREQAVAARKAAEKSHGFHANHGRVQ